MKIGLEISSLSFPLSGIQVYIKNFLNKLLKINGGNSYILTAKLKRMSKINGYNPQSFWFKKYDIFHGFDGFIPRCISAKLKSAVIHDVIPLVEPSFVSESAGKNFKKKMMKLINRADILIVPSQYTKDSLSSLFPSERIYVIHEGYPENFRRLPEGEVEEFKKRNDLGNYLLYVGVINARKNVHGLIKAFTIVRDKRRDLKLVIISSYTGYGGENAMDLIYKNRDSVILMMNVNEADLLYFYNAAQLFVFPSFREGFGLPVLEAMACGTPVVTSRTSALIEVGGDAVEYVNPYDINDIADKISEVLEDERKRNQLRENGLIQASKFSWEKSARDLVDLWKRYIR